MNINVEAQSPSAELQSLLQPLQIGNCRIPNRLMMSALTLQYGENGSISDAHAAFYRERAEGGVGLILSEQLNATPVCASPFPTALHADDVECAKSLRKVIDALKGTETKFFAQLFASGACGAPSSLSNFAPLRAPSSIGFPGGQTPLPLSQSEIDQIVRDFASSAANAQAAGCHGVEIHGAHGWLIGEFFSPYYNRRDDEYGGSLENRCRFALAIGKAVRDAVGAGFPLGISLTYDEMIGDAGITPADTLAQVKHLAEAEVFDFFDFSIGSVHNEHFTIAPMDVSEGFALDFAREARRILGGLAVVMVSGRVVDINQAARAVREGQADAVAMSRAHIAEPSILKKSLAGESHLIRRCIGDNVCLQTALAGEKVKCLVNPRTGRESEIPERMTTVSGIKRIVVVGAGPAGLTFANRTAAAGHEVIVHEKLMHPGGHVRIRSMLPTRETWQSVTDDLVASFRNSKGKLTLGSTIADQEIEQLDTDLVVIATGAGWEDSTARFYAEDSGMGAGGTAIPVPFDIAVQDTRSLGTHVIIFDETGSFEPLGLAEKALLANVKVTFITPRATAGDLTRATMEYPHIIPRLRSLGIGLICEAELVGINGHTARVNDSWGNRLPDIHEITSLVFTSARKPRISEFVKARSLAKVRVIGDAFAPRETAVIMHDAFFEAANL